MRDFIRAVGCDPGLASFAVGVLDWDKRERFYVAAITVNTKPGPTQPRSTQLSLGMDKLPTGIVVAGVENQEKAWAGAQRTGKTNSKATLARVGEGQFRERAHVHRWPLIEVTPEEMRASLALPRGAEKADMHRVLRRVVRGIPEPGEISVHALDALVVAFCVGQRWTVLRNLPPYRGA
jgi:Holliday junction resolvasome RuvABC endonuclease subunit